MRRLYLVRHAPTAATRAAAFPVDEPLDENGRAAARAWHPPSADSVLVSPAIRCRETASLAGLLEWENDPALAECDFGTWGGRTVGDVDLGDWMTNPDSCHHGGESLTAFSARVAAWLDTQASVDSGRLIAVTHGGVIKAALVHALGAPLEAFWQFDVAPLSVTELHCWDGRWTVTRSNAPAATRAAGAAAA
jgi:broad specificity phosphatase PhoE